MDRINGDEKSLTSFQSNEDSHEDNNKQVCLSEKQRNRDKWLLFPTKSIKEMITSTQVSVYVFNCIILHTTFSVCLRVFEMYYNCRLIDAWWGAQCMPLIWIGHGIILVVKLATKEWSKLEPRLRNWMVKISSLILGGVRRAKTLSLKFHQGLIWNLFLKDHVFKIYLY